MKHKPFIIAIFVGILIFAGASWFKHCGMQEKTGTTVEEPQKQKKAVAITEEPQKQEKAAVIMEEPKKQEKTVATMKKPPAVSNKEASLRNVLFITCLGLRSDHLSCYGYARETSPNIDAIAKQGARCAQTISQSTWSLPSIFSIITSTYPHTHGITSLESPKLRKDIPTLIQLFKSNGYFTTGGHFPRVEDFGFDKVLGGENAEELTEEAIKKMQEVGDKPWFMILHYDRALNAPYYAPAPYDSMYMGDKFYDPDRVSINSINKPAIVDNNNCPAYYIARYDGAIKHIDDQVGRLLGALDELKIAENTLIIISAPHGEFLTERPPYFHNGGSPYEPVIRIPLIMRWPWLSIQNVVIQHQVQQIDIGPTILDSLHLTIPEGMEGQSLLPALDGATLTAHSFSEVHTSVVWQEENPAVCVRTPIWKLIYVGSWELYNLPNDPLEKKNLVGEEIEEFQALRKELETHLGVTLP